MLDADADVDVYEDVNNLIYIYNWIILFMVFIKSH